MAGKEAAQQAQVFSDSKWDAALDTCLRRAMYGTLAGGAAALLLLRECGVARLGMVDAGMVDAGRRAPCWHAPSKPADRPLVQPLAACRCRSTGCTIN